MKQPLLYAPFLLLTLGACAVPALHAEISLTLDPSLPSPQPVGAVVTWQANATGTSGTLWYRFRSRKLDGDFRMIKDFGPYNTVDWTAVDHEGLAQIEVTVIDRDSGETAATTAWFEMTSNVVDQPVINPTAHPLVYLYSAPACDPGARMRVQFRVEGSAAQSTPWQDCQAGLSMNFYLAGMQSNNVYSVQHMVDTNGATQPGPALTLNTGDPGLGLTLETVLRDPKPNAPNGILLQSVLFTNPVATDLAGNVVWYYPGTLSTLTRPDSGGYFLGVNQDPSGDPALQVVREFDLTGMTVLETNAARVGDQLVAMGHRPIGAFHHEARRLSNGYIAVLGSVEQILTDVQQPGPVDVLGDMIVVLDQNLQVVWAWDTFDHLDPSRAATLNDSCAPGVCPPLQLAAMANDWTHGNSLQETPDGNLLYSARSQDWVIKINYQFGAGPGDIIWKLGKDGDIQMNAPAGYQWFSHQHDPGFLPNDTTLLLFDNGNGRWAADQSANSHGQVLTIDQIANTATVVLDADLGYYSLALGSAQKLPNGNYHFETGFLADGSGIALEVDASGKTVYALQSSDPVYRSFRMADLYTPPN